MENSNIARPTSFRLGTFDWKVNYLDIESETHGETHKSTREINITCRAYSEQVIKDTLLHECMHVVLEDIIDTTCKMEGAASEVEEQLVRLVTPRLHELFTNNVELREYIFSNRVDKLDGKGIRKKALDKSGKK